MSVDATRRGRPKGSGLDDQKQLDQIARMIAAKPDLKPTTAIKALGISDPSVIRRLRDKFQQFGIEPAATPSPANVTTTAATARPTATSEPRSIAASVAKPSIALKGHLEADRQSGDRSAPVAAAAAPVATVTRSFPTPADMFVAWVGLGLSALTTAMSAQAAMASGIVRLPPVEFAIRQQLIASEMVMAINPLHPRAASKPH
ncbi:MAG: hypothetical protein CTY20_02600 [Hyphomicrobium sp.]|nr:MAG: hypothetical protein CTY20_02600 [Hyphomicrobium sp.]